MPFPWWHFALVAMVSAEDANESWDSDYNETNWTQPMLSPCGAQRPPETYDPLTEAHDPGPASLGEAVPCYRSPAQSAWLTGRSPERRRFERLGVAGPPTPQSRELAASLSQLMACGICQQLLNSLWEDLHRPTATNLRSKISEGCPRLVKQHLLRQGWMASSASSHCDGGGKIAADGASWCFLQDTMSDVIRYPDLAEHYDPAADSLIRACEDTIAFHMERVIIYLTHFQDGAPATLRNEALMRSVCVEAACCE
eukprot:Skav202108  [mRNA]  locus=scaffold1980:90483:92473:+ [translate_table: standard]